MIKVKFSDQDLQKISHLRYHHPCPKIQKRMEVLWLGSLKISREMTALIAQVHPDTVTDHMRKFSQEGLDGLLRLNYKHPSSRMQSHFKTLKEYFVEHLPRNVKEACLKIKELTQIERKLTQVRCFLKEMGFRYLRAKSMPAKADTEQQDQFKEQVLLPVLEEAKQGKKNVFFVDGAHFTHCAVLGYVWSIAQIVIPSFSGRQRFNVLGAVNAISHRFFSVCNDTYINATNVCALMSKLRQTYGDAPLTLILDNARYQKCKLVAEFAVMANIDLLYLPPYSPNLNLIERVWKFIRKEALSNAIHRDFSSFQKAISDCCNELNTTHKQAMKSLLTFNFQNFRKKENLAA